ncbi:hypothetical protein K469DRAFT_812265 [Zopfia rhizophila CBS 207.26]|uniref:Zinc-binding domain-containing protein n=1 Tax=Zopfia rhizophila CBS 207.26 TaxID=1314779 RepID=A0A6A6DBP7_9PEZI|nr:hypothetical protein K469DRAFT_812265 [Zopfia rhizophila CBS 207.26]
MTEEFFNWVTSNDRMPAYVDPSKPRPQRTSTVPTPVNPSRPRPRGRPPKHLQESVQQPELNPSKLNPSEAPQCNQILLPGMIQHWGDVRICVRHPAPFNVCQGCRVAHSNLDLEYNRSRIMQRVVRVRVCKGCARRAVQNTDQDIETAFATMNGLVCSVWKRCLSGYTGQGRSDIICGVCRSFGMALTEHVCSACIAGDSGLIRHFQDNVGVEETRRVRQWGHI